ncbi:hypothetical protein ADUPG1_006087, partial [Aduncisulcus paluster]
MSGAAIERFFSVVHHCNIPSRASQTVSTLMLNSMKKFNKKLEPTADYQTSSQLQRTAEKKFEITSKSLEELVSDIPITTRTEASVLKAPMLTKFSKEDYFRFKTEFKKYKSDGGKAKPQSRVKEEVALLIEVEVDNFNEKDLFNSLDKHFSCETETDVYEELRALKMRHGFKIEDLREYIGKFLVTVSHNEDVIEGHKENIARIFAKGIFVFSTRDRTMELITDGVTEVKTLAKEALKFQKTMDKAKKLIYTGTKKKQSAKREPTLSATKGDRRSMNPQGRRREPHQDWSKLSCKYCGGKHPDERCWKQFPELRPKRVVKEDDSVIMASALFKPKLISSKSEGAYNDDIYVEGYVKSDTNQRPVKALIDTGCQVNMMTSRLIEALNPESTQLDKPIVVRFDGKEEKHTEAYRVMLTATNIVTADEVTAPIMVIKSDIVKDEEMIIGANWCIETGIVKTLIGKRDTEEIAPQDEEMFMEKTEVLNGPAVDEIKKITFGSDFEEDGLAIATEFAEVFDPTLPREGCALEPLTIELTDTSKVIVSKPRRLSPPLRKVVDDTVRIGLKDGLLQRSDSEYASPVTMAKKRSGDYRVCNDYTAINEIMKNVPFPLPNVEEMLSSLGGLNYFTSLDLRSGFNQIMIEEGSRKYTAFVVPGGLYEYLRMPFGLKIAPAHFQKELSKALGDLIPTICQVYIDDIVIGGKTKDELLERTKMVLKRLKELRLRVKAEKCYFGVESVEYLGRLVSRNGITISPSRFQDVLNLKPPESKKQLRSLCGLVNYYRNFIPSFQDKMAVLTKGTKVSVEFAWTDEMNKAFNVPENGHHILLSLEEVISWPKPCSPLRDHSLGVNKQLLFKQTTLSDP